jgi:hypothetical protein
MFLFLANDESDWTLQRWRRHHQLADGIKEVGDGLIVALQLAFQFPELRHQFLASEHFAQAHEGVHDLVDSTLVRRFEQRLASCMCKTPAIIGAVGNQTGICATKSPYT